MLLPKIYIGTAGWSYKDWVPNFYPKNQSKDFDWLKFYSNYFNVVEVNATYYAYLNPKVVSGWIEKTEDVNDFLFTIKLHNDFTHKRKYDRSQIDAVQYNLDILQRNERLGGLLIQFPYSFSFNDSNFDYLNRLLEIFDGYEKFVEVRHSSWENEKAFSTLTENRICLCTIDQPIIGRAVEFKPIITSDTAYIRFHGRNVEAWKQSINNYGKKQTSEQQNERYKYLYSPGELVEIEQKIKEVYDNVKKVFVIMNNHPSSYGVANAFELLYYLKGLPKVEIPKNTIAAFPRLSKIALN